MKKMSSSLIIFTLIGITSAGIIQMVQFKDGEPFCMFLLLFLFSPTFKHTSQQRSSQKYLIKANLK